METPIITYAIIGITVITSYMALNNPMLRQKMIFNPFVVVKHKEYLRTITSGIIHADYMHLFVNMWVLYMFGSSVEFYFQALFGAYGGLLYLLLYILGIGVSHIPALWKHYDSPHYNSLGASGATSAILFASILINPLTGIGWPGIYIPGFIFGLLYLLYSHYMQQKALDNVAHDAHFMGAVFGFVFTIALKPGLIISFAMQIKEWSERFV